MQQKVLLGVLYCSTTYTTVHFWREGKEEREEKSPLILRYEIGKEATVWRCTLLQEEGGGDTFFKCMALLIIDRDSYG